MGPKGYELAVEALGSLKDGPFDMFPNKPPRDGEKILSINVLAGLEDFSLIIGAFTRVGICAYPSGQPSAEQLAQGLPALDINWGSSPGSLNFQDLNPDSL